MSMMKTFGQWRDEWRKSHPNADNLHAGDAWDAFAAEHVAEIERLKTIVDALPSTADGAPIVSGKTGSWIQTYTGKKIFPLCPTPEQICIEDIAHALSLKNRFSGHTRIPYSVAEHSLRVARYLQSCKAPTDLAMHGLLHDAAEAYLPDVSRPIKKSLTGFAAIEALLLRTIFAGLGVEPSLDSELVKHADDVLLATEARDLMCHAPNGWETLPEPLTDEICPWAWQDAESRFLGAFHDLKRAEVAHV